MIKAILKLTLKWAGEKLLSSDKHTYINISLDQKEMLWLYKGIVHATTKIFDWYKPKKKNPMSAKTHGLKSQTFRPMKVKVI